ncbi:MAG: oxaloacetate decarboxylase [Chloroflexi bacterium]|nr:oxaloacetate decarboxylase [Chloroflexota bacterium]
MLATQRRERIRKYLAQEKCIQPAPVFDPISARIAQSLGFEVAMMGGSVASAVVLGAPDLTVLTLTELADQVRRITRASDLSLIVDADHGYGNALNVMRTVEELEAAGVSALTIEDNLLPAPFGQKEKPKLISLPEMVGKLGAALEARQDPSLVIIGRTESLPVEGMDKTLDRIIAYAGTGVDAIFPIGIKTIDEIEAVHKVTDLPLILGSTPSAASDLDQLASLGVRIALAGHLSFHASVNAIYDALKRHAEGKPQADIQQKAATEGTLARALNRQLYDLFQEKYLE